MNILHLLVCIGHVLCRRAPSTCVNKGDIALVYSDGPVSGTPQLMKSLDDHNIKATFMCSTVNIDNTNVINTIGDMSRAGHTVGLRTNPMYEFTGMEEADIKDAIKGEIEVLSDVAKEKIKYITVNQEDVNNPVLLKVIDDMGLILINYNYDMYGTEEDPDDMINRWNMKLKSLRTQNASYIVLQHDQRESEMGILPEVVEGGKSRGFRFVNMQDCLDGADMGGEGNDADCESGNGQTSYHRKDSSSLAPITAAVCFIGMLAL